MKATVLILILFLGINFNAICDDANSGKPDEEKKSLIEEWKETLQFGISDEILPVIEKIKDTNEESLYPDLVQVFSESISIEVRKAILSLFSAKVYTGAKETALQLLENYDEESSELIIPVINYLAEINAIESLDVLDDIIEDDQVTTASAALGAISKMKAYSKEEFLLEKLNDDEFSDKIKPEIIRTLGDIKAQKAVDILMGFLENTGEEKTWRLYSAESLGKIGDPRALPLLKKVFEEKDSLVKAYSAKALAAFDMNEVIDILIQGLKDSNWKVRQASAQALANPKAIKAVTILKYKAEKDPVKKIKIEAMKALSEINTLECRDFLLSVFEDERSGLDLREQALAYILEKNPAYAFDAINRIIDKDWMKKNNKAVALQMLAKKLSQTKHSGLSSIYKRLLDHEYFLIRIFAIRGIIYNQMSGFRSQLETLLETEKTDNVKQEIKRALEKL